MAKNKTARNLQKNFKFIDLFAGIGGFHIAASEMGGKCVFVSEFDKEAKEVYQKNFAQDGEYIFTGDITKVDEKDVPRFNFLFAGFPCQPFSKGGHRRGFEDIRGTLFFDVARIIALRKPEFVLLENVSNLVTHDDGKTYATILETLDKLGYALNEHSLILSPHHFGIPVIRQRVFIPAIRKDLIVAKKFNIDFSDDKKDVNSNGIYDVINTGRKPQKYYITKYEKQVLQVWDRFYQGIDLKVIGFPIWAEKFKGSGDVSHLPQWKANFILKNRALYKRNQKFIDQWLKCYDDLEWMVATHRKMEWQAGQDIKNIYEGLIQFRPSGVRVKRPDKFSTLVAMNQPQIIGKYKRRLTSNEAKKLQSLPEGFNVHENDSIALKQLGNAVNVEVVKKMIKKMFKIVQQ